MTFWESAAAASIGAFVGFLGALLIFFIKEKWQQAVLRKSIVDNLKLEISYNINLYDEFENQIQNCIEALSNDSRGLYLNLDYDFVGTHFAKQFYQNGLLLAYFHPEDMRRWNVMLTKIGAGADKYVTDCVDQWREEKEIAKEEVYRALKQEKEHVAYAKEMSKYIQSRL